MIICAREGNYVRRNCKLKEGAEHRLTKSPRWSAEHSKLALWLFSFNLTLTSRWLPSNVRINRVGNNYIVRQVLDESQVDSALVKFELLGGLSSLIQAY